MAAHAWHHDVFGQQLTAEDMAELAGLRAHVIRERLRAGRTAIAAMFEPLRAATKYSVHGQMLTIEEMAALSGRPVGTIRGHLQRGATAEEAFDGIVRSKRCRNCGAAGHRADPCRRLKGTAYGSWTILYLLPRARARCKCVCGTERDVLIQTINEETAARSCGCTESTVGERVGKLTVKEDRVLDDQGRECCRCLCDCGAEKLIPRATIVARAVESCGCLRLERMAKRCEERRAALVGHVYESGVKLLAPPAGGGRNWTCQCPCGETFMSTTHQLESGRTKTCGCGKAARARRRGHETARRYDFFGQQLTAMEIGELTGLGYGAVLDRLKRGYSDADLLLGKRERPMGEDPAGILGQPPFDRLTPVRFVGRRKHGRGSACYYECDCVCGKKKVASAYNLKSGMTRSCGCLQKERASATAKQRIAEELAGQRPLGFFLRRRKEAA